MEAASRAEADSNSMGCSQPPSADDVSNREPECGEDSQSQPTVCSDSGDTRASSVQILLACPVVQCLRRLLRWRQCPCPCVGGGGLGDGDGMSPYTLEFLQADAEDCFSRSLKDKMMSNLFWVSFVFVLADVIAWIYFFVSYPEDLMMSWIFCTILGSITAMHTIAAVASVRPKNLARLGVLELERIVVLVLALTLWSPLALDPWYLGKLIGIDPMTFRVRKDGSFRTYTDTKVVLANLSVTFLSHLTLSIRWKCTIPLEASAVLISLTGLLLGSPEGYQNALMTAFIVFALIYTAAIGKRTIEKQERLSYRGFLAEKKLRVRTEFMLSQLQCTEKMEDDLCSRPSTTTTGCNLKDVQSSPLERIVAAGIKEAWLHDGSQVQLHHDRLLGTGSHGVVMEASFHGVPVAAKAPRGYLSGRRSDSWANSLVNEFRVLRRLRHPSIVSLLGACVDVEQKNFCLVLDLVIGVPLADFASGEGGCGGVPGDVPRLHVMRDIGSALQYLHTRWPVVVHGDLKDTNIFVEHLADSRAYDSVFACDSFVPGASGSCYRCGGSRFCRDRAKLLDFGLARLLTRQATPLGGTLRWMAPEVFKRNQRPDAAADVYSFGAVVFLVITGVMPMQDADHASIRKALETELLPPLKWPENCDGILKQVLQPLTGRCVQADARLRPLIQEAMECIATAAVSISAHANLTDTADIPPSQAGSRTPPAVDISSLSVSVHRVVDGPNSRDVGGSGGGASETGDSRSGPGAGGGASVDGANGETRGGATGGAARPAAANRQTREALLKL